MRGKLTALREIKAVIYHLRNNCSNRSIERAIGIDRSIVGKIKNLAIIHSWLDPELPMPNDEEITKVWVASKPQKSHPLDLYRSDIQQWRKEGLSAVAIRRLLINKCDCDIQSVRRYLNKHFSKAVSVPKQVSKPVLAQKETTHIFIDIPKKKTFMERLEEVHTHSKYGNAMSRNIWEMIMADIIMEDEERERPTKR